MCAMAGRYSPKLFAIYTTGGFDRGGRSLFSGIPVMDKEESRAGRQQSALLLVEKICAILRSSESWGSPMEESLEAVSKQMQPFHMTRVLTESLPSVEVSLHFFKWAEQLPGYKHEPESYDALIVALTKFKFFHVLEEMFHAMKQQGFVMNRHVAVLLIRSLCEEKMWASAVEALCFVRGLGVKLEHAIYLALLETFEKHRALHGAMRCYSEMLEMGYHACLRSFKLLINLLSQEGKLDEVLGLFYDMNKFSVHPDKMLFSICIHNFCQSGNVEDAWDFFQMMHRQGLDADTITLGNLVVYTCKSGATGQTDYIWKFLEEMESKGYHFPAFAYAALIRRFSFEGRPNDSWRAFERACKRCHISSIDVFNSLLVNLKQQDEEMEAIWELFLRMKGKGLEPNLCTYSLLSEALSNIGWEHERHELQKSMLRDGRGCSITAYNMVIHNLCRRENLDEAMEFLQEMRLKGFFPDNYTYSILISGFCKAGKAERALQLLHQIYITGEVLDVVVCSSMLDALCKAGKLTDAEMLHEEMISKGICMDKVAFNTLIYCSARTGKFHRAFDLLRLMQEHGYTPDKVSYTSLILSLTCSAGVAEAYKLFDLMKMDNCELDTVVFNTVIGGLCTEGRIDEAFMIFKGMEVEGHVPSKITYGTLIDGLGKSGRIDDALLLMRQMNMRGLNPNVIIYGSLANGLGKVGRMDDFYKLLEDMTMRGCIRNVYIYNGLLRALRKHHKIVESMKIFERMKYEGCKPNSISYKLHIDNLLASGYHTEVSLVTQKLVVDDIPLSDTYQIVKGVMLMHCPLDKHALDHFLTRLANSGELHHACELFKEMSKKSLTPNIPQNVMNLLRQANNLLPLAPSRSSAHHKKVVKRARMGSSRMASKQESPKSLSDDK